MSEKQKFCLIGFEGIPPYCDEQFYSADEGIMGAGPAGQLNTTEKLWQLQTVRYRA